MLMPYVYDNKKFTMEKKEIKTHKVIDQIYHSDEAGHDAYCGTLKECYEFIGEQSGFGYAVVPLTPQERKYVNEVYET